jgi:hypothetical protein
MSRPRTNSANSAGPTRRPRVGSLSRGDARATGDDLSADDRLNRLREHLPIRHEVGSEHVLRDEDLAEPALQII